MPVPKKRHSNTRSQMRRANWKLKKVTFSLCPQCGAPILPHHACKKCGSYNGRTVIVIKQKKDKKKEGKLEQEQAKKEKASGKEGKSKSEIKEEKKEKK